MAISDTQKVDLLYKKLFGATKTDLATNKSPSNEAIASPALNRGDTIWAQASSIPGTAAAVANVVQAYQTTARVQATADSTTTPISSVYPTWKTGLTDWIPPEFGSTYFVKVYADTTGTADPTGNTALSDAGIGGVGEWFFDYQSGVLNFIGGTIPATLTASKVIFITGYRYIGTKGLSASQNSGTANTLTTARYINLSGDLQGNVLFDGSQDVTIVANVISNAVALGTDTTGDYVANITAGTGVTISGQSGESSNITVNIGQAVGTTANVTFGSATITRDVSIGGNLYVTGNLVALPVQTLVINDPLIQLANTNVSSDIVDIGFFGSYGPGNDATHYHTGLFRDHTDGKYKLFSGLTEPPTSTVNTSGNNYTIASLVANIVGGTVSGLTANILVSDGGTGRGTFTSNGVLFGNGSSSLRVTAAGSIGQVLRVGSDGTPSFGGIDGGTY